jgi:hypothetical protein
VPAPPPPPHAAKLSDKARSRNTLNSADRRRLNKGRQNASNPASRSGLALSPIRGGIFEAELVAALVEMLKLICVGAPPTFT